MSLHPCTQLYPLLAVTIEDDVPYNPYFLHHALFCIYFSLCFTPFPLLTNPPLSNFPLPPYFFSPLTLFRTCPSYALPPLCSSPYPLSHLRLTILYPFSRVQRQFFSVILSSSYALPPFNRTLPYTLLFLTFHLCSSLQSSPTALHQFPPLFLTTPPLPR